MDEKDIPETIRTNETELAEITGELAKVVADICGQITHLKEEREATTGEVRKAYGEVIANKVWILQTLIGGYWRKTLDLTFDDSLFAEKCRTESNASAGR